MIALNPHKTGLVLGVLLGGWHFGWSLLVAAGWAQPLIDFVFEIHFIRPVYVIEPFSPGRAILLIVLTAGIGYAVGLCAGALWNGLHGVARSAPPSPRS